MVDKAFGLLKEGQYEKSREAIDIATDHPSTAKDARAWYLKSYIYKENATTNTSLVTELRNTSIEAALRCMELDSSGQYTADCQQIINYIFTDFLNESIVSLNQQDFEKVLTSLQPIIESNQSKNFTHLPEAWFYSGYAKYQLEDAITARPYFFQAMQLGYQDPLIYDTEVSFRVEQAEWDSAHWYLIQGRSQFPEDKNLQITELNFLMGREDYSAAELAIEKYIMQYPGNIDGLLLAGTIYEKLLHSNKEGGLYFQKQISSYEQIINKEPNHLQANYNLGIAYYNRAVKLINGASQNYSMDIVAFNTLLEQCSELFLKALPFIKKVNTLDNNHVNALKALEGIYYNINDYQQYSLVKEKLEKL